MSNLVEFAEKETERIEAEKQKHQENQNLPGFFKMVEGENVFQVLDQEVREHNFGDGVRKIFRIKTQEGERCTIFEIYAIIENVKHLFNVQSERDVNNQIDAIAQGKKLEEFD